MNVAVKELSKREVQKIAKKAEYEGRIYPSKRFGDMAIIEYLNCQEVVIKFLNTGYTTKEWFNSIKSGEVRDNSLPTTCGVGFIDIEGASIGRNMTPVYVTWNAMLQRCYNENLRHKHITYKDCTVSESFKYLSKFKKWYDKQVGHDVKGFQLDKDILVKGNKVYSEDTCCFVPQEINCLITTAKAIRGELPIGIYYEKDTGKFKVRISMGSKQKHVGRYRCKVKAFEAYKEAKEQQIKVVAEKWKHLIDVRVYEALINYKVEITD